MNPKESHYQTRANEVWTRFVGMFGGPAVERKFGLTPPPEWIAMMSRLTEFQIDRGIRRLAYNGAKDVPSLPQFTSLCRAIGNDEYDEGPQRLALPAPDTRKFDGCDIAANLRLLNYIKIRFAKEPRAWGAPGSIQLMEATQIAVRYKNAWAQDMRELGPPDLETGELPKYTLQQQNATWDEGMRRAEADIAALSRAVAA